MKFNTEPIKKWFGFSRQERRASFILIIILLTVIIIRYSYPSSNIRIEYLSLESVNHKATDEFVDSSDKVLHHSIKFDPNVASYDTLIRVGLSSKEANTLIKYRNKGGKFRQPDDIRKIYGIDNDLADKIISDIIIEKSVSVIDSQTLIIPPFNQESSNLIELNNCDSAALVRLPGIGPVLSVRILKYRKLIGGFSTVEQLKNVYGLSEDTYNLIKDRVNSDSSLIEKTKVNYSDFYKLSCLPYIEKYEVTSILKYRELKGKINGISDLVDNKLITSDKAKMILPYLSFE